MIKRRTRTFLWVALTFSMLLLTCDNGRLLQVHRTCAAEETNAPPPDAPAPTTVVEARTRAQILHETIHGALQVMHRDLFREDEKLTIPSQSLEDVFKELHRSYNVEARWLAVNTQAMNVDHQARTKFEKNAVKALASGEEEFESIDGTTYRHAGIIRLSSQCLKCHLPNRTSTEDRAAGLVISIPLSEQK